MLILENGDLVYSVLFWSVWMEAMVHLNAAKC